MTNQPQTISELCDYIHAHASDIYVREQDANGAWGTFALTDLKAADAIKHALRFVQEGRIPVVVRDA